MKTVHIVDADAAIRDSLITFLESFDIPTEAFRDSDSFLRAIGSTSKGCVLVEAELPGINGLELLRSLRNNGNTIPVVLLTSISNPRYIARAKQAGVAGVLQKPFIGDELVNQLKALDCLDGTPLLDIKPD